MFQIDVMSRTSVYEQIVEQMEKMVLSGILPADAKIPSVRSLSVSLSINPNTIQKAYTELDRKGLIYSVPGKGSYISKDAEQILIMEKRGEIENLKVSMRELAMAGISEEEMLAAVREIYEEYRKKAVFATGQEDQEEKK